MQTKERRSERSSARTHLLTNTYLSFVHKRAWNAYPSCFHLFSSFDMSPCTVCIVDREFFFFFVYVFLAEKRNEKTRNRIQRDLTVIGDCFDRSFQRESILTLYLAAGSKWLGTWGIGFISDSFIRRTISIRTKLELDFNWLRFSRLFNRAVFEFSLIFLLLYLQCCFYLQLERKYLLGIIGRICASFTRSSLTIRN